MKALENTPGRRLELSDVSNVSLKVQHNLPAGEEGEDDAGEVEPSAAWQLEQVGHLHGGPAPTPMQPWGRRLAQHRHRSNPLTLPNGEAHGTTLVQR